MSGLVINTNRNDGAKMPRVAKAAPGTPANTYPMKVAAVRTGPGVNCPMAIALRSSCWVSQPCCSTRPPCRNATRT